MNFIQWSEIFFIIYLNLLKNYSWFVFDSTIFFISSLIQTFIIKAFFCCCCVRLLEKSKVVNGLKDKELRHLNVWTWSKKHKWNLISTLVGGFYSTFFHLPPPPPPSVIKHQELKCKNQLNVVWKNEIA